ncbi:PAS domain S-box protein [Haloarchaeobius salinus]|uniref:PAS domain S-box protein n=1 Tax=Haloarchaeobius salinus TaxID=1198298 RepID=UPI00210B46DF|nr:PAS domain S-box protein [Haloarchaeobius salinus]
MTGPGLTADQARRDLYEIMQTEADFEAKARGALDLGKRYLRVDNAHLTRIHPEAEYWEAIASTDPSDGEFPTGLVLDYNTTYCRHVLDGGDSVALHDVPSQGWTAGPAFEEHGLHCYHGTPIQVDGEPYGTVCFVSESPRDAPFTDEETLFAELVARLLEHELQRQRHEVETTRRSNSITILSRVLRHNLRNEMTVVRGRIGELADQLDDDSYPSTDLFDSIDRIIDLSDKARKLETVVFTDYDRELVALEPILDRIRTAVGLDYPDATITTDVPEGLSADLKPSFELAVTELVENAADHSGPDARVAIHAEATDGGVTLQVSDDGPGLPEQEQAVLSEGVETPLVHGSGLGLWMAYWVVTTHDGTISATVTDEGTTVTISVPRVTSETSRATGEVAALQRGLDRFEAVFEESFDAMLILDDDRRVIDANDHAADLLDLSKSALLGRSIDEFVAQTSDVDALWTALQAEGQQEGRLPVHRPDGPELVAEYSATADVLPGQHLIVGRDVTDRIERERERERMNQRLTLALEGTDTGIWEWDLETDEVTWTESMERLFGVTPGTFEGTFEAFADRVHPEDLPAVEAAIERAIETGEQFQTEYRVLRDDGEQLWVDARGELFEGDDAGHRRFLGIVTDITERKERERSLRTRTRAIDDAPIGVAISDPGQEDNPMVYVNEQFCELTGYDESAILGRNCRFMQGEETNPDAVERIRSAIDGGEPVSEVLRNYRADGTMFWNQVTVAPVEDEHGEIVNWVGFQQDVTDRIERERELQETTSRLEAVVEASPEPILTVDAAGVVQLWNEAAEAVFGYPAEDVVGESLVEVGLHRGSRQSEVVARLQRVLAGEQLDAFDVERTTSDGDRVRLRLSTAPLLDADGTVTGVMAVAKVLSDRAQRLELAETVFENTQDALFLIDVRAGDDFVVERVNQVYETVTGLSNEEIVGKRPREIVGDETGAAIEERYRECVRRRETIQYLEDIPVDGESRQWETKLTPVVDDGTVEKLVGAMRDVTDE